MTERKLLLVELTYDDGVTERVCGVEAEKWLKGANATAVSASIHGVSFPRLKWESVSTPQDRIEEARKLAHGV